MSDQQYIKSEFKERTLGKTISEGHAENEFFRLTGRDVFTDELENRVNDSAAEIMKHRYGNPIQVMEPDQKGLVRLKVYSDEQLAEDLQESHKENLRGKTFSSMTKGKRVKSANKKINLQTRLAEESKILLERRKSDRQMAARYFDSKDVKEEGLTRYTEEELESVREFMIVYNEQIGNDEVDKGLFGTDYFAQSRMDTLLKEINKMEPEEFAYKSDAAFVSGFAVKYDKLCKGAAAGVLLDKYVKLSQTDKYAFSTSQLKAKIEMFKALKEDYELRMKLISSPAYVLLAKKDLEDTGNDADPEVAKTREILQKLESSNVGKGKDLKKEYARTLKRVAEEKRDEDCRKVSSLLGDYQQEGKLSQSQAVKKFHQDGLPQVKQDFPEDGTQFLQKVEPVLQGTLIEGISNAELKGLEDKIVSILTQGKLGETDISKEHLDELRPVIESFIRVRRDTLAESKMLEKAAAVTYGTGMDILNPMFKKTKEYKRLERYLHGLDGLDELRDSFNIQKEKYSKALRDVFVQIRALGYSFTRYEARLTDDKFIADALETGRAWYEKMVHGSQRKEEWKREEFPTFTLNGEKITTYANSDLLQYMVGQGETVIDGEQGKEILEKMKEYAALCRKQLVTDRGLEGEGGEKSMLAMVLREELTPERVRVLTELKEAMKSAGITLPGYIEN